MGSPNNHFRSADQFGIAMVEVDAMITPAWMVELNRVMSVVGAAVQVQAPPGTHIARWVRAAVTLPSMAEVTYGPMVAQRAKDLIEERTELVTVPLMPSDVDGLDSVTNRLGELIGEPVSIEEFVALVIQGCLAMDGWENGVIQQWRGVVAAILGTDPDLSRDGPVGGYLNMWVER